MQRKLTYRFIVLFSLLLIALRLGLVGLEIQQNGRQTQLQSAESIKQLLLHLADLDKKGALTKEELVQSLTRYGERGNLEFFRIEKESSAGREILFESANNPFAQMQNVPPSVLHSDEIFTGMKAQLSHFVVTAGTSTPSFKQLVAKYTRAHGHYLLIDCVLLLLLLVLALRFRMEILRLIASTLEQLTPRDLQNVSHPTQEMRAIVKFLRTFIDQVTKAEIPEDQQRKILPDGIGRELFGARKPPPYQIQAVVLRFELSRETRKLLQEKPASAVLQISRFYQQLKELRQRYGGLDYQALGDEKVIYFRIENGDHLEEQLRKATAFVRDSFSAAATRTANELSPFFVKVAMVPGTLMFYEIDGNHYFSGTPLQESRRLISTITDRDRSILCLPTVHNEKIKVLGKPLRSDSVSVKGLDSPMDVSYFDQFSNQFNSEFNTQFNTQFSNQMKSEHNSEINSEIISDQNIDLYLSDQGLIQIKETFMRLAQIEKVDQFLLLFQKIRNVRVEAVDPEVVTAYSQLLDFIVDKYRAKESDNKILSCAISLSWIFVPCGQETSRIKESFYNLVRHKDVRVASNALMASQRYEWNQEVIDKMLKSPSNRLRGDALVLLGRRGVDERFFIAWRQLVESRDQLFVLSGLWASQEVFKFHTENNPSHMKGNPLVENMIDMIKRIRSDSQKQIGQRAQWALEAVSQS